MLTWEQTDELNEIATDMDKSPEQRNKDIRDTMARWAIAVHTYPTQATNFALFGNHEKSDIDPGAESVKARVALPGQTGRYYYPGA